MKSERWVLLAEDDSNDVLLLQLAFREAGLRNPICVVNDGQEAIDYLSGEGKFADRNQYPFPALLILDLKMPRKTGFDVLDWTRGQEKFKCLPVIILTASSQEEDIKRAYVMGANSYLVKPVSIHSLTEMIKLVDSYWLGLNQHLAL